MHIILRIVLTIQYDNFFFMFYVHIHPAIFFRYTKHEISCIFTRFYAQNIQIIEVTQIIIMHAKYNCTHAITQRCRGYVTI